MSAVFLAAVLLSAPTPVRLPAEVDDAYALRFNPAGLGRVPRGQLRLFVGQDRPVDGLDNPDYGFGGYAALPVFGRSTFGLGFEADERDGDFSRLLTLGLGTGRGPFSFGFSYSVLWPFDGDDDGFWSLGAQMRPTSWLALGFATRDVGQSVTDRQYDTGLALQPWSRLTLGARWRYEENERLDGDTLDLAFRGEVEPVDGVLLGVVGDLDGRFFFQLGLSFERFSVGGQVELEDGQAGFTTELAFLGARRPGVVPVQRVSVIELAGDLRPEPTFSLFGGGFKVRPYGGVPIYLERLRQDDELVGALVRIGSLDVGWATAYETRTALARLRDSGRRVDCLLTGSDDKAYYVASGCTTIIVPPALQVAVNGVQAKLLFLGEAFERYGVEVEVYRREEYKTAPDTFARAGISPAQRETLGAYIDQVQTTIVDGIADGRRLSTEAVREAMARGVLTSSEAVSLKLADRVMYPDEVEQWVRDQYRGRVVLASGEAALQPERPRWGEPPVIALIHIDATITAGESRNLPFGLGDSVGARSIMKVLERAERNPAIRAVVLRVDSPGGSAFASDIIARGVRKLAQKKPVVASFGDVAASGGYYVASGAKVIFAEPTTLTGSIGVFSVRFSAETLLRRIGINGERLGPGVGSPVPYLSSTPEERKIAEKGVEEAYRQFLRSVAEGRKVDVSEVAKVAGGRIWTGADAKANGLVDEIGGLVEAIKRARVEAGLSEGAPIRLLSLPDRIQPLPLVTRLARSVGVRESPPPSALDLWPRGLKRLVGPLIAVEPDRPGAPPALAWLPRGLSVD